MYVSLRLGDMLIGIMSVYAPTDARSRARFWSQLAHELPEVDSWIVGGDFNNLDSPLDFRAWVAPAVSSIADVEQDAWDSFLMLLRCEDVWFAPSFGHRPGSLDFSWGFPDRVADCWSVWIVFM